MTGDHEIEFSANCDAAVEHLGGYSRIADALIPLFDVLRHNPRGCEKVGLDWNANHMFHTGPIGSIPALVWLFYVMIGGKVVVDHVEEFEEYLYGPEYPE
jgi:hypothetical protein